ncbi:predicted protein [Histoplasma mississippiense (nom. inval.)]|uniref:predicted protein n=1 Tax=Ajellomyces capsulatus (strain NAm1 / WU24) TaxID=2059318 RepID=UPI000157BFC7|nr:predicted protein [Histoplasma mississippiense (nom. inval.)]EDN06518.1 predicted protein [Histoplasma mississippiense (nom. inval.)]
MFFAACISLPKGMETCYAGEISMYTERENRIQVATLEKTQLIAKDFSELRIHFWPDKKEWVYVCYDRISVNHNLKLQYYILAKSVNND